MPVVAILLQGAAAIVIALSGSYGQILSYVVSVDFILFGLTGAALFVFRRRDTATACVRGARPSLSPPFCSSPPARWSSRRRSTTTRSNSAIGFAILAAGVPACLYWQRRARAMRAMQSDYMYWAKTQPPVRYNLASSEVPHFRMDRWAIDLAELELDGASRYRYPPLREAIARQMRRDARPGGDGGRHLDGEHARHGGADRARRRGADRASGLRADGGGGALSRRRGEALRPAGAGLPTRSGGGRAAVTGGRG